MLQPLRFKARNTKRILKTVGDLDGDVFCTDGEDLAVKVNLIIEKPVKKVGFFADNYPQLS